MSILSDEFYYQHINLDTVNTQVFTNLTSKVGDTNGRGLIVTLTENGLQKDTTGISLNLKWKHRSVVSQGLDNFDVVDLSKGVYKITYPTEMNRSGLVDAFVQIVDGTKIVGTRNMIISVESTVGDDSAIESSNSFTALASALIEVQSWNDRIDVVEQEFIDKANNLDATYPIELNSVKQQLEQIKPTGIVSFIFDDNGIANATLDDIFAEYGFVFSNACIVAGNINNSASNVGLFELIQRSKKGFNLLSHGVDSVKLQTSLGYGKAWSELKNSRDTLRRWGFQCNGFVCPNNYLESIYVDYVKRNYSYAFERGQSNIAYYPPMKTNQDRYAMQRFHIDGNGASIADIKTLIDNTVAQAGLTVFYGHSLAASDGTYKFSEARIREILAYCQTKVAAGTLAVMNTDEAVNRFFGISFPYTEAEYATANLSPSIETFVYQKAAGTANATKTTGENTLTLSFPIDTIVQRAYLNATLASAVTSDGYNNRIFKLAVMASSSKEVTVKNRIKFTNSVTNEFANADIVYVNGVPAIKIDSEHATKISLVGENISVQIWYEIECPIYTEAVTVTLTNSVLQLSV